MSHWRIDNPCCGHAPFQSFTPRFPWPMHTTCSCHVSMSVESLAISCVPVCSVCLGEFGEPGLPPAEGSRSQLFECKRRTHTRWLCRLCMLYNMTKCVDWQIMALQDTIRETQSITNVWSQPNWTSRDETCKCWSPDMQNNTANYIVLLLSCPPLQSDLQSTTPSVYSSQALNISVN